MDALLAVPRFDNCFFVAVPSGKNKKQNTQSNILFTLRLQRRYMIAGIPSSFTFPNKTIIIRSKYMRNGLVLVLTHNILSSLPGIISYNASYSSH
ncbi:hypothetical protein G7K_4424-t1 [Saitoella complicata NRRL Y-17804]|uniref:Uncharacterized protein n=1 Tax=Saitoella complicata (strain BCRC 22490 / CBS 7301 / JCM 7358 / NBRC 10748 / NRRL Y-17804) TaxID=698492 RepID=A0A0E9NKC7_SAICN|nr:hypothetical protein G7K_4424-t1 [Saitoella complicata NRRL Y-17804]